MLVPVTGRIGISLAANTAYQLAGEARGCSPFHRTGLPPAFALCFHLLVKILIDDHRYQEENPNPPQE